MSILNILQPYSPEYIIQCLRVSDTKNMSILDILQRYFLEYISQCLEVLDTKIEVLELDYSNGETDVVHLLFVEKNDLTQYQAVTILTMRLMMYQEQWKDVKNYEEEDFERWIPLLEKQYAGSVYSPDVDVEDFKKDYFVERLTKPIGLKNIRNNAKTIDFLSFKRTNPLFHEKTLRVSKTNFMGLQEEFYVETTHHFVLFNWYTTA